MNSSSATYKVIFVKGEVNSGANTGRLSRGAKHDRSENVGTRRHQFVNLEQGQKKCYVHIQIVRQWLILMKTNLDGREKARKEEVRII